MDAMAKLGESALLELKALAAKLGLTVEQVYPYFVRQVYLESMIGLLCWFAGSVIVIVGGACLFRYCHRRCHGSVHDEDYSAGRVFGIILMALGAVFILCSVGTDLPDILNPHYEAVRRIAKLMVR